MERRVALPRQIAHSETLDRLIRLKHDFAVLPFGWDDKKWKGRRMAGVQRQSEEGEHKRMIRDAEKSIKGIDFPAEEMAKIIRSWMKQDED